MIKHKHKQFKKSMVKLYQKQLLHEFRNCIRNDTPHKVPVIITMWEMSHDF